MDDPPDSPVIADSADVSSLDAIVNALYALLSFRTGGQPPWARFRSLFDPSALMVRVDARLARQHAETGTKPDAPAVRVSSLDDWIARTTAAIESGALSEFDERELTRRTEVFGDLAAVFSTYERNIADDVRRGINSVQLVKDGERWWVISICWTDEIEHQPLPSRYLPRVP
jgi:hypothetical protein